MLHRYIKVLVCGEFPEFYLGVKSVSCMSPSRRILIRRSTLSTPVFFFFALPSALEPAQEPPPVLCRDTDAKPPALLGVLHHRTLKEGASAVHF